MWIKLWIKLDDFKLAAGASRELELFLSSRYRDPPNTYVQNMYTMFEYPLISNVLAYPRYL